MKAFWRHILFFAFVLAFLITAPLVVLYTAGYRYQFGQNRIVKTGVLSISTIPRGATIFLDGKKYNDRSPTVIDTILPGKHLIRLERDGYSTWSKTLDVYNNETTFANNVVMFFDDELVLSKKKESKATMPLLKTSLTFNGRDMMIQNLSDRSVLSFVDENNVADIVAYLPAGSYKFEQTHKSILMLVDQARERIILVNPNADQPILLNTNARSWKWRKDVPELVFSDGFDVQVFYTHSLSRTTVTRLSEPVIEIAWYSEGNVVLYSTSTLLYALELDRRGEQNQYILAQMQIESFELDEKGERLFITGTKDGERGIFVRRLQK